MYNACNKFGSTKAVLTEEMQLLGSTDTTSGPPTFNVDLAFNNSVNINLVDERKIMVVVTAKEGFAGNIKVTVDRSSLAQFDAGNNIEITPTESMLDLTSGQSKSIEFIVRTRSLASTGMAGFSFVAAPVDEGYSGEVKGNVMMVVNPMHEVRMSGPGNAMVWSAPAGVLYSFKAHPGMKVRFINLDPVTQHRVHIDPGQYHQPNNLAINGGMYEINIPDTANLNLRYHCHLHGGADRLLRFNVP